MVYSIVTIRSGDDVGDDALYPELSGEGDAHVVQLTPEDGAPATFVASGLKVIRHADAKSDEIVSLSDVKVDVVVTDCRVALGCTKYEKGGGWSGFGAGAIVAVAANGVSKALAARRRRGKALVGQIRYSWLKDVGGSRKQGWLGTESLRLTTRRTASDGGEIISLTLLLDKQLNSLAIAREVAQRAARWRLENDVIEDFSEEQALHDLLQAAELQPVPKSFAMHHLPTNYPAASSTAYSKRSSAAGDGQVPTAVERP